MENKAKRLRNLVFKAKELGIAGSQKDFGELLGYKNESTISAMIGEKKVIPAKMGERIRQSIFHELSLSWWETGNGEMFGVEPQDDVNSYSIPTVPVIPRDLCEEQDLDKYEVVQSDDSIARSPIVQQFATYDTYYNIYNDEMAPYFLAGDKLAIAPYNQDDEVKLVNGRAYVVDTKTNGMLLRLLYKTKDGYRAVAYNERYGEEVILFDEVIRVFRVLGLIRTQF